MTNDHSAATSTSSSTIVATKPHVAQVLKFLRFDPSPVDVASFNPLQVEMLVNQSADILDRLLGDLHRLNSILADSARQSIDLARERSEINAAANLYAGNPAPNEGVANLLRDEGDRLAGAQKHIGYARDAANSASGSLPAGPNLQAKSSGHSLDATGVINDANARSASDRSAVERAEANVRAATHQAALTALEKREAAGEDGGALSFNHQVRLLHNLIDRDRKDAYVRLVQASKGMGELYGAAYADWCSRQQTDPILPASDDLVGLITWTRTSIAFLAARAQRDQTFSVLISVVENAEVDSDKIWNGAGPVTFLFPAVSLEGFSGSRVRGVLASLVLKRSAKPSDYVGPIEQYPWKVTISKVLPERLATRDRRRSTVVIGRVQSVDSVRPPDLAGAISLYNVDPIGQWTITLERPSRAQLSYSDIDDVILEVVVAATPKG